MDAWPNKLLLATDGSEDAELAAVSAVALSKETGSELHVVAVAEEAPERTLLAVGSRGLGAIGRMRLGSVSTKVVHAAKGPVLVHPPLRGET